MKKLFTSILVGFIDVSGLIGLLAVTWIYFGPILGFHHVYWCGLFCPIGLDGETPQTGNFRWGDFGVHLFPIRIIFSVALWAFSCYLWYKLVMVFRSLPNQFLQPTPR
jgi:hypothetical protein